MPFPRAGEAETGFGALEDPMPRRPFRTVTVLDSPFDLPLGRLLALDLGCARHGVAVCDATGVLATPLTVLPRRPTRAEDFRIVSALVIREGAVGVLVGLPLESEACPGDRTGGDPASPHLSKISPSLSPLKAPAIGHRQARWTRRYAGRLAGALPTGVPLAFWDENLSTQDAEALLAQSRGSTPPDAVAAAIILQDFLEARRHMPSRDS